MLPGAEIWKDFPVFGMLALFLGIIGWGARAMVRELRGWQREQDAERAQERQEQREWQEKQDEKLEAARAARDEKAAEQERKRDQQWQEFFAKMNNGNLDTIGKLTEVNRQLVERIDALTVVVRDHDGFVREHMPPEAEAVFEGPGRGVKPVGKRGSRA